MYPKLLPELVRVANFQYLHHHIPDINRYMKIPRYKLRNWININRLEWGWLSPNPAAIDLLKANPDKIEWMTLSYNLAAINLIKSRLYEIDWYRLSTNPAIFIQYN